MPNVTYTTLKGVKEESQGSDGRLNTSSRSASRIHYISRDDKEAYSLSSNDATAAAATHIIYWQNTDTSGRVFFLENVTMGGVASILWKVHRVSGTAAGGSVLTPVNLNGTSSKLASATARGDDAVTGLTIEETFYNRRSSATGSVEYNPQDAVIIGQNQAISVEVDAASSTDIAEVTITGYYEVPE